MDDYQAKLKKVKDLYLDLGVAIGELQSFRNQQNKPIRTAQVIDRIKVAFKNRPGQILNIYQISEMLGDVSVRVASNTMAELRRRKFLTRVGIGTYIYKSKKDTNP